MKKLVALAALVFVALAPAVAAAQAPAGFTGKWDGTFILTKPDGTKADPREISFNLTQKGKVIDGTAGPAAQQQKIEKGVATAGKATFDVPLPNGSTFRFALTIVKGHLQGDMTGIGSGGAVTGKAKVDATKAKPADVKK
jgi:hypothetical protein